MEKRCSKCGIVKGLLEFSRDKHRPDGLTCSCRECRKEASRVWRKNNPEKKLEDTRSYRTRNADAVRAFRRAYREANLERQKELARQSATRWNKANPEKRRQNARQSNQKRRTRPEVRLRYAITAGLRAALLSGKGGRKCESLIGYSVQDLKLHLERQFLKGMSWANYGQWHIDHIIPVSAFRIEGPDDPQLRRAWALPNLRPLWAVDNMRKNNKIQSLL